MTAMGRFSFWNVQGQISLMKERITFIVWLSLIGQTDKDKRSRTRGHLKSAYFWCEDDDLCQCRSKDDEAGQQDVMLLHLLTQDKRHDDSHDAEDDNIVDAHTDLLRVIQGLDFNLLKEEIRGKWSLDFVGNGLSKINNKC